MENLNKVAEDVRNLVDVRLKGLLNLADALAQIGNIQQAEREALNKADKAKKDASIAVSAAEVEQSKLEALKKMCDAEAVKGAEIKSKAQEESSKIRVEAKLEADKLLNEAQEKKFKIEEQIKAKKNELLIVGLEIEGAKQELESLKKEFSELKVKLSSILKG